MPHCNVLNCDVPSALNEVGLSTPLADVPSDREALEHSACQECERQRSGFAMLTVTLHECSMWHVKRGLHIVNWRVSSRGSRGGRKTQLCRASRKLLVMFGCADQ